MDGHCDGKAMCCPAQDLSLDFRSCPIQLALAPGVNLQALGNLGRAEPAWGLAEGCLADYPLLKRQRRICEGMQPNMTEAAEPIVGHESVTASTSGRPPAVSGAGGAAASRILRFVQPLRLHLSLVIVLLLLGISVPLMLLAHRQGTASAVAAASQQMRLLSRHAVDRYSNIFGDGLSAIALTSVNETFLTEPPDDIDGKTAFLLKALAGSSAIDGIYVGYPTGSFVHAVNIAGNPGWRDALSAPEGAASAVRVIAKADNGIRQSTWRFLDGKGAVTDTASTFDVRYDPRRRPWYKQASGQAEPIAVGPYVMATTKSLGLTLALPMASNGDIVVGADVLLQTLSDLLAREAVSPNARGYVFDDQRRLIVHSEKMVMQQILDSLSNGKRGQSAEVDYDDPAIVQIEHLLETPGSASGKTVNMTVGGQQYLVEILPVAFSNLVAGNTVVIAAPLSDFTADSMRVLRNALIISTILLTAGILAALMIARLISTSLTSLTNTAMQIGDLDVRQSPTIDSRIAEINTLANALGSAREAIRTFALYVPRELVRRIVASGQSVAGNAVRQRVTVLFTDIQDFTTISERHSPEDVVAMLSTYFQVMNEIVERNNGVIIQYLGDSIYAMWNAPSADERHVEDGCRCALELKAAIDAFNADNRRDGRPELITRFGLHTGVAVVGSVGARSRLQYTAMGDTINVASRLEGMNKQYRTTILASGAVREVAKDGFSFRPLGTAQAKGRHEEIEIFELSDRQS